MKIEPGFYKCRNGSRARVLCTDAPGSLPIAGYVIGSDEEFTANPFVWRPDGQVFLNQISSHDLIEPWREPVRVSGWCVVNTVGDVVTTVGSYKDTEEFRDRYCAPGTLVYVTGTEGVGPEDGQ